MYMRSLTEKRLRRWASKVDANEQKKTNETRNGKFDFSRHSTARSLAFIETNVRLFFINFVDFAFLFSPLILRFLLKLVSLIFLGIQPRGLLLLLKQVSVFFLSILSILHFFSANFALFVEILQVFLGGVS
jgi:cytochrome b subunit of formate dehydrogenase